MSLVSDNVIESPVPVLTSSTISAVDTVPTSPSKSVAAPDLSTELATTTPVLSGAAPVHSSSHDESLVAHDTPRDGMTETPVASGTNPNPNALAH